MQVSRVFHACADSPPTLTGTVQVDYLGFQGKTVLDPEHDIVSGPPTEKPVLPGK